MGSGDKTMGTFCVFPSSRLTDDSEGRGGEGRSVNNSRGIFCLLVTKVDCVKEGTA